MIVPASSAFARTTFEENRIEVDLGWTSPLTDSGPGAGGEPTAAALLSDLVRVSPPPNHRVAEATPFVSVPDRRQHRWLIGARVDSNALSARASAANLTFSDAGRDGDFGYVVTDPASWERTQSLLAELEALNAAPFVARYELSKGEEAIQ